MPGNTILGLTLEDATTGDHVANNVWNAKMHGCILKAKYQLLYMPTVRFMSNLYCYEQARAPQTKQFISKNPKTFENQKGIEYISENCLIPLCMLFSLHTYIHTEQINYCKS